MKAKLRAFDDRVDLSASEKKAVRRMLDSLGEKRGDLLDAVLASKGATSRADIAKRLGYEPKPPSTVPRLYPHDIAQLDQLVVDGLLHTERHVSEGAHGGRGREVVYMVASAVRQVDDEIKRDIEREHQRIERERKAALERTKHAEEKAKADAEEAKLRLERAAANVAALETWRAENPQKAREFSLLKPMPPRRPLGMTAKEWNWLGVLALGLVCVLVAVGVLLIQL